MQPFGTKKIMQPLGTKKKYATSLNYLSGHFEFVTAYLGLVLVIFSCMYNRGQNHFLSIYPASKQKLSLLKYKVWVKRGSSWVAGSVTLNELIGHIGWTNRAYCLDLGYNIVFLLGKEKCLNDFRVSIVLSSTNNEYGEQNRDQVNYPKLDTRISFVRSFVCHTQGTPPGFWNGLDWRALVED